MPPVDLAGRLIAYEKIMSEPLPSIDWLVEPLIPHGTRAIVFGEFGSMKSWLLLHLGLHIAAGRDWLGRFVIPHPKSVLYLDEEMSERELRRRIKRLGLGAGLERDSLPFQAISQLGVRFDSSQVESLLTALQKQDFDPDIIIVETLRRVLTGSENEASDVSDFWRNVSPILTAGKTLIVSHHMRKPFQQGRDHSRNRASGSTDILAGTDSAFALKRALADTITVECVKSRAAEEPPPFVVSLCDQGGEDSPIEMRCEGIREDGKRGGREEDRVRSVISSFLTTQPNHTSKTGDVLKHLQANGFTKRTAERAMNACKAGLVIEKAKHGVWRLRRQFRAA